MTKPNRPRQGDIWINTKDEKHYWYSGEKWIDITPKKYKALDDSDDSLLDYL